MPRVSTILLTGFEAFDGAASNSSGDAVALVASRWSSPIRLVTAVLPVAFDGAPQLLGSLIAEHRPELVIATGLANGRPAITPERLAINLADARESDELVPEWFPVAEIPTGRMWDDARYWVKDALAGRFVKATFEFGANLRTVSSSDHPAFPISTPRRP
jgi:hypothetical protein